MDGFTRIQVRYEDRAAVVPVTISSPEKRPPVDFVNEVEPVLTRYGCNSGGCHGKASGQNGFKLSLFGFDSRFDYAQIADAARGRRVFPAAPAESLLLQKATGGMAHGGGRRLNESSEAYATLRRWISEGTPRSSPNAPAVVSISIEPAERSLTPIASGDAKGREQQLSVIARYNDGATRDVTHVAQFGSNMDVVASVDDEFARASRPAKPQ